jgi:hypothetical protein
MEFPKDANIKPPKGLFYLFGGPSGMQTQSSDLSSIL